MPDFFRSVRLSAVCLMGLAHLSPVAAQLSVDQRGVGGSVNVYNLDRSAHVGGVEIHGTIDADVARQAIELIRSIRPDVDELMVYLSSPGGDVLAAIELGEEVRSQWALTTVGDDGECFGACVLVLAAGVRRTPEPERVGLQRLNFDLRPRASQTKIRGAGENRRNLLGSHGNAEKALPRDKPTVVSEDASPRCTSTQDAGTGWHRPGL
jgi:hypothetical protein